MLDKKLFKITAISIILFCILLVVLFISLRDTAKTSYDKLNRLRKSTSQQTKPKSISTKEKETTTKTTSTNDNKVISKKEFEALSQKTICNSCHAENNRLIGPSYQDIAKYYQGTFAKMSDKEKVTIINNVIEKIKIGSIQMQAKGYRGPWIEQGYPAAMTPNNLTNKEIKDIFLYIIKNY